MTALSTIKIEIMEKIDVVKWLVDTIKAWPTLRAIQHDMAEAPDNWHWRTVVPPLGTSEVTCLASDCGNEYIYKIDWQILKRVDEVAYISCPQSSLSDIDDVLPIVRAKGYGKILHAQITDGMQASETLDIRAAMLRSADTVIMAGDWRNYQSTKIEKNLAEVIGKSLDYLS